MSNFGLQENGIPNFFLIVIYLFQFISDLISSNGYIFYEGASSILAILLLIFYYRSNSYLISTICFVLLTIITIYYTGLLQYYDRLNILYIITLISFMTTSILGIIKTKKN